MGGIVRNNFGDFMTGFYAGSDGGILLRQSLVPQFTDSISYEMQTLDVQPVRWIALRFWKLWLGIGTSFMSYYFHIFQTSGNSQTVIGALTRVTHLGMLMRQWIASLVQGPGCNITSPVMRLHLLSLSLFLLEICQLGVIQLFFYIFDVKNKVYKLL